MNLRKATVADLLSITELYYQTITVVNQRDYTPDQINAWRANYTDKERWLSRIKEQYFLVAENEHEIAGFGSLASDGYLDLLFVHKDYQRRGIAKLLLTGLEHYAQDSGIETIYANVSLTARPFFEAHHFRVEQEQIVEVKGIQMQNFRMVKRRSTLFFSE